MEGTDGFLTENETYVFPARSLGVAYKTGELQFIVLDEDSQAWLVLQVDEETPNFKEIKSAISAASLLSKTITEVHKQEQEDKEA